ncbi:hypothetical protein [Agaribacter flavus]|uniref:Uncharacterized protein n=1 Tax=Agaribacter flavus TaxID=1902781 RepID=A0ABV7FL81_9ALTE
MDQLIKQITHSRSFSRDYQKLILELIKANPCLTSGLCRSARLVDIHSSFNDDPYQILHDPAIPDWEYKKFSVDLVNVAGSDIDIDITFLSSSPQVTRSPNKPTEVYCTDFGTLLVYSYPKHILVLFICDPNGRNDCWFFYLNLPNIPFNPDDIENFLNSILSSYESIDSEYDIERMPRYSGGTGRD